MKTPKSVRKAMRYMGMTTGDSLKKVVVAKNAELNKKKNELKRVANIVKRYENMLLKNEKNKGKANKANTKVKKMARNYSTKIAAKDRTSR